MTEKLLAEIEHWKESLQSWQQREREAHDQACLNRGIIQGLTLALELAKTPPPAEETPAETPAE